MICTHRRPGLLAVAIESLIAQSLPHLEYEIIVVDNNSLDETPEIVRRLSLEASPKVSYLLEFAQGLSQARNTGLEHARGEIVAFLDDDAEADRDWLAELLEIYDDSPDAWAVGGKVLPIWDAQRPEWLEDTMLRSLSIVDWGDETRPLDWPERVIGTNCSFRKRVFSELGRFATNLGRRGDLLLGNEDTEVQERIHKAGKLVVYTPHAVVHHHVPRERMTKSYFCRRAYGNGRSQALLMAGREGHDALARQALRMGFLGLPRQCLALVRTALNEDRRFRVLQGLAHHYGFLYQATRFLLLGRDRAHSESAP